MYSCELYNNLPTLQEAQEQLTSIPGGPENVLNALAPIFKFHPKYGICLVHAHCTLANGEKMVSSGRISEPVVDEAGDCYPERWLANGVPYEFSSTPTVENGSPPSNLIKSFYDRLGSISESLKTGAKFDGTNTDLSGLLGIYYIHDPDTDSSDESTSDSESTYRSANGRDDIVWMERTEGRRNIVEPVPSKEADLITDAVTAAWFVTFKKEGSEDEWITEVKKGSKCVDILGQPSHLALKSLHTSD